MLKMLTNFFVLIFLCSCVSASYRPVLTASGCGSVKLGCEDGGMVAVREASFTPDWGGVGECEGRGRGLPVSNNHDIWRAVVRRCNGVRDMECVFDMGVDLPESASWGRGRTDVRYSCEESVHSYCGGRVEGVGEGYISSPGYPRYYLGGRECVWTLSVGAGQNIQLQLADLSLRETGSECEDSVMIKEVGKTLLHLCGQLIQPIRFLSATNLVEVRMRTAASRQQLYPRRGLLLHFTPHGCAAPPPIAEGSSVQVNSSLARLTCNPGHILQSTLSPVAMLACSTTTHSWTPQVEHCVSVQFLTMYGDKEVIRALSSQQMRLQQQQSSISNPWQMEAVVTTLVGCMLVFLTIMAICVIYRTRTGQQNQEKAEIFGLKTENDSEMFVSAEARY